MDMLLDGTVVILNELDIAGVRALIAAHARSVVDIQATTSEEVNHFVADWLVLDNDFELARR